MAQYQRQLPASVYWRRRLVVFGGLIAVIAVIVLIIVRPGFGSGSATDAAESAALTDAPTLGNCLPSQIELVPRTDQNTYDSGVSPQLWMGIRNLSAVDCILSVGTDVQRYEIRSGDDLIWSSTDCQQESAPLSVTLMAGSEQETVSIPWDRSRSTPETCEPTTTRPTMPGGGASYHLRVFLGETASAETRQFLLN
jgi:hypothetical protein